MENGKITFSGGDGSSIENAIVIEGVLNGIHGVSAEYKYIEDLLGPRGNKWNSIHQELHKKGEKQFDELTIELDSGEKKQFFFDISLFFSKY